MLIRKQLKNDWQLYTLLVLPVCYLLIFKYVPFWGLQIAFKDFVARKGIAGSPWADPFFKFFLRFFNDYNFFRIIRNTLFLSFYGLAAGFPLPIIFALTLNYVKSKKIKKTVQMITYAPHFISMVVVVGMIMQFFATRTGIINQAIVALGGDEVNFLGSRDAFPHLFVWSQVWQSLGFNSIIYIAVLSSIDPCMHEAAIVEGASKMQRMRHIDLPGIMPTAIVLLILNMGRILNVGFEKVLLMQNNVNIGRSEIISTYVYKVGLEASIPQFSYATAIGLFQSIVGLFLIVTVNRISGSVSETSLY